MSRIGRNLVFLLVSQLATWSVTLVVLVIVPKRLGDADFGKFGFATTFVQYFALIASLGTPLLLTKLVARDASVLPTYVFNAIVLKMVLVAVLSVVAVAIAVGIGIEGDTLTLVVVGCVWMLFVVLNEIFVAAQAGLQVMGRPAMWSVVQTYVASILGLVIVLRGGGVVPYGVAFLLAPIVPLIANGRRVWPWITEHRRIDFGTWHVLTVQGAPLLVLNALNLFYATIDIPILNQVAGEASVGWYMLAYRYVAIPVFIATAAVAAFFPSFSAHGATIATTSGEFGRQVNQALRLVTVVAIPAAAGLFVIADDMIRMIYGDRFSESIVLIQILALHIPTASAGVILGTALVASDRHRPYLFVAGVACVIAPFLGFGLIRWSLDRYDNGAIGAAISTVILELVIMTGAILLRAPGVIDRFTTWFVVRTLAASVVMAVVVAAVPGPHLLVRVWVGTVTYVLALMAFGVLRIKDVRSGISRATSMVRSRRDRASG